MALKGKLTKANMASTIPVDAPVFGEKPFYYKETHWYQFNYETDGKVAASVVPEQFTIPEPATAALVFLRAPWTTIGTYQEAFQGINVEYKGETLLYIVHMILNQEIPILVGRDILGFPKKKGFVEYSQQEDILGMYVERPQGIRIASGVMRIVEPIAVPDTAVNKVFSLRAIPSPEKGKKHSLVELLRPQFTSTSVRMWKGVGSCSYTGASVLDPWDVLPIKKMLDCFYLTYEATLDYADILETL